MQEYSLSGDKAAEIRDWLVDGWTLDLDMDKQKETVEEMMDKMPLVVAIGNQVRCGGKISEDEFVAAYGQLISVYPQLAKDSLEKMVGAFFEVSLNDLSLSLSLSLSSPPPHSPSLSDAGAGYISVTERK